MRQSPLKAELVTSDKILLTGDLEHKTGMLRSLPDIVKVGDGFRCLYTPATASKLIELGFEVSQDLLDCARDFENHVGYSGPVARPAICKTEPWDHQIAAYSFAVNKKSCLLALEMGTGKSKIAIDLAANWGSKKILVVCPKSVLGVWRRELAAHCPVDYDVTILDKGPSLRKASMARHALMLGIDKARFIVVNYASIRSPHIRSFAMESEWDLVILDESHKIKSPNGKTSKILYKIGKTAHRRLCMTGTPMPHSPLDVFGQFRFLDAGIFGTSYPRFRSRYAVTNDRFPSHVRYWINEEELRETYHSMAYRVLLADVINLPPVLHQTIEVELHPKAMSIYQNLVTRMIAEIGDGTVTVGNALTRLLRLQQITSGHVKTDDGEIEIVDSGKSSVLKDLIESIDPLDPVIVFCRFKQDLEIVRGIAEALDRQYGEISGSRKDLTSMGTLSPEVKVCGVQIQAGGVGIDLTSAAYAIYYSIGFSLGDYEQSLARVHRPGQTRSVRYYHLVAEGTVDSLVYRALEKRRDVVQSIIATMKEEDSNGN